MADKSVTPEDLVQIARLALTGRPQDIQTYIQRLARRYRSVPAIASQLTQLLQESPTRSSPLRRETAAPLPVDLETRFELLRVENHPVLDIEPV